jgi:hypothetical protein
MSAVVRAVLTGSVRRLGHTVSGIDKHPTVRPQRVERFTPNAFLIF